MQKKTRKRREENGSLYTLDVRTLVKSASVMVALRQFQGNRGEIQESYITTHASNRLS